MYSTIDGLATQRRRGCSEVIVVGSGLQLLLSAPAITTAPADPYRRGCKKLKARKFVC
jgi:hypothetical protein